MSHMLHSWCFGPRLVVFLVPVDRVSLNEEDEAWTRLL